MLLRRVAAVAWRAARMRASAPCAAAAAAARRTASSFDVGRHQEQQEQLIASVDPWTGEGSCRTGYRHRQSRTWPGARGDLERDGYTIVPSVLPLDVVHEARDHFDYLRRKFPNVPTEHFHHVIYRNDPFWVRLAGDDRLLDVAAAHASFLKKGIVLFASTYFCKMPGGMPVSWHQDGSYWALDPMEVVSIWLSMDYSGPENGCMQVVRGSHRDNLQKLVDDRSTVLNVLGARTHTDEELKGRDIVDMILLPGDVAIFHPNLIHGSQANHSAMRRCGLTVRYIPPTVQCTDPAMPVMMLRGEPVEGINTYRSWPKYRPGLDFEFTGASKWNTNRIVSLQDPEPHYFDDDSPEAEAQRTAHITAEIEEFIGMLGGRSLEDAKKPRKMQPGAFTDEQHEGKHVQEKAPK